MLRIPTVITAMINTIPIAKPPTYQTMVGR